MEKTYFVLNDKLGGDSDELGALLMEKYLYSLARAEKAPARIIFMNGGVRLTCEGSPVLDDLKMLADKGTLVQSCGTCLDFYKLREQVAVGEVSGMDAFVGAMLDDADVVTLR